MCGCCGIPWPPPAGGPAGRDPRPASAGRPYRSVSVKPLQLLRCTGWQGAQISFRFRISDQPVLFPTLRHLLDVDDLLTIRPANVPRLTPPPVTAILGDRHKD